MQDFELVYIVSATIIALLAIFWLGFRLRSVEKKKVDQIKARKRFDSVIMTPPVKESKKVAQKQALENIRNRFRSIRKIGLSIVLSLGIPLLILPILEGSSSIYISLFLGITTAIIGIAARPIIENSIAGLVLSIGYPARVGDTVSIDGHYGTIERIGITQSTIKIWDWKRYLIPNTRFIQKEFINHSWVDTYEWAYVEFWLAPDTDLEIIEVLATKAAEASSACMKHEKPVFWIMGMDKDAIKCWICAWAETPSFAWQLKSDIRKNLIQDFHRANINCHKIEQNLRIISQEKHNG